MGFLSFLKSKNNRAFMPDFNKTEYENWLNFLEQGGTSQQWNNLKKENKWLFKKDSAKVNSQYEVKFRPLFNEYFDSATKIKSEWSVISSEKVYTGHRVELFIELCKHNIEAYRKMVELENKHNKDHLQEAEGYKRLAMLYEKQGEFDKAISICKEAIQQGDVKSMPSRLIRMIRKLNREPTEEEVALIKKTN